MDYILSLMLIISAFRTGFKRFRFFVDSSFNSINPNLLDPRLVRIQPRTVMVCPPNEVASLYNVLTEVSCAPCFNIISTCPFYLSSKYHENDIRKIQCFNCYILYCFYLFLNHYFHRVSWKSLVFS